MRRGYVDTPFACVLGDMDLVRPLGTAGIPVATVGPEGSTPRFSRWTRAAVTWSGDTARTDELADALLAFAAQCDEAPVLYFQNDAEVLFASRERERLAPALGLPLGDPEVVEDLLDKRRFGALAAGLGLPVPGERLLDTTGTPGDQELRFPLIVKPPSRGDGAWAALGTDGKALRVGSPDELAAVWPLLGTLGAQVVAQDFVPGEEDRIESYHCYVDAAGETAGEFTGRKIRTRPRHYGFTTSLEITDQRDVRDLGRDVVARLGLRGVAKVDLKRAPDGELVLLEVNPRFNLWHHPGAVAGVNLPAIVHADLTGRPRPPVATARVGVRWCNALDAAAAREHGVSLPAWLRWAAGCEARAHLTPDDPGAVVGRAAWRLLQKVGRR
jgi:D-aspartate ligase